jgi:hypothetical protein
VEGFNDAKDSFKKLFKDSMKGTKEEVRFKTMKEIVLVYIICFCFEKFSIHFS